MATLTGKSLERSGPDFVRFFDPVLQALKANDASARPQEVYEWIIENLNVSDQELQKTNKNGRSNFENKVAFARFYLVKAGYLDGSTRGVWALTESGRETSLDRQAALEVFDYVQKNFGAQTDNHRTTNDAEAAPDDDSPISGDADSVDEYLNLQEVQTELVALLRGMSDKGFEEFCARILRSIGFENVKTLGGSGDGGIDGIGELLVNRFLRTRVAFQCKRYGEGAAITPDKVRDFRGAIAGRVERGIFITTSRFTKASVAEAQRDNVTPVELIDLSALIDILVGEKIGVDERKALRINRNLFSQYSDRK